VLVHPPGAPVTPDEDDPSVAVKAVIAANKCDAPEAADALELLELEVDGALPIVPLSAATGEGIEELRSRLWRALDVIRVYTKPPGKPVDRSKPFVLGHGATVGDLADAIHHELRQKLKYGHLWGASSKFAGQRVGHGHVLEDEDVVELYA
jgi:ribosome-interacting GTPase 1